MRQRSRRHPSPERHGHREPRLLVRRARHLPHLHLDRLRLSGKARGRPVRGGFDSAADEPLRPDEARRRARGSGRIREGEQGWARRRASGPGSLRRRRDAGGERGQCPHGYRLEGARTRCGHQDGPLVATVPDEYGGCRASVSRYLNPRAPSTISPNSLTSLTDVAAKYLNTEERSALPRILQFSSEDKFTKYEICQTFAEIMGLPISTIEPNAEGNDPNAAVQRPYDCHLSTAALKQVGIDVSTQDFVGWWRWQVRAFRK